MVRFIYILRIGFSRKYSGVTLSGWLFERRLTLNQSDDNQLDANCAHSNSMSSGHVTSTDFLQTKVKK